MPDLALQNPSCYSKLTLSAETQNTDSQNAIPNLSPHPHCIRLLPCYRLRRHSKHLSRYIAFARHTNSTIVLPTSLLRPRLSLGPSTRYRDRHHIPKQPSQQQRPGDSPLLQGCPRTWCVHPCELLRQFWHQHVQ